MCSQVFPCFAESADSPVTLHLQPKKAPLVCEDSWLCVENAWDEGLAHHLARYWPNPAVGEGVLRFKVSSDGQISSMQLKRSTGLKEIDDAAIDALWQSAPEPDLEPWPRGDKKIYEGAWVNWRFSEAPSTFAERHGKPQLSVQVTELIRNQPELKDQTARK